MQIDLARLDAREEILADEDQQQQRRQGAAEVERHEAPAACGKPDERRAVAVAEPAEAGLEPRLEPCEDTRALRPLRRVVAGRHLAAQQPGRHGRR